MAARLLAQLIGLAGELGDRERRVLVTSGRKVQGQPVGGGRVNARQQVVRDQLCRVEIELGLHAV